MTRITDPGLIAILPCTDLDKSRSFYERLGFVTQSNYPGYVIMGRACGARLHLSQAEAGWLIPGKNPMGLYLYTDEVDALAARFSGEVLNPGRPEAKPWGMYEFALSDPDETLVRIGRPIDNHN
jgi:catechol 2,3-dioxygenase-like lactoylglutathione lyase family enzyme